MWDVELRKEKGEIYIPRPRSTLVRSKVNVVYGFHRREDGSVPAS